MIVLRQILKAPRTSMNVLGSEQEEQKVITLQKCFNLIFKKKFFFFKCIFLYVYIYAGGNYQTFREEEKFAKSEFCHYK